MENMSGAAGAAGASLLFTWILSIAGYVYMALVLQAIAKKTNTENAWFAWIPILNFVLMIQIAQKPVWWIILLLIPIVNIVIVIIIWLEILKRRNYPGWWIILMFIPIVNLIIIGVVAWKDREGEAIEAPSSTPPAE
ncbi:hypothetical protein J7L48_03325 [bacterium]|nr:hypothetical protein [bacterium]